MYLCYNQQRLFNKSNLFVTMLELLQMKFDMYFIFCTSRPFKKKLNGSGASLFIYLYICATQIVTPVVGGISEWSVDTGIKDHKRCEQIFMMKTKVLVNYNEK